MAMTYIGGTESEGQQYDTMYLYHPPPLDTYALLGIRLPRALCNHAVCYDAAHDLIHAIGGDAVTPLILIGPYPWRLYGKLRQRQRQLLPVMHRP